MNPLELLATQPTFEDLRGHALILSVGLNTAFAQIQEGLGDRQFMAQTVALTDGRYMLGADLLSEIHPEGGLYHLGFEAIPPELLAQVEVIPMADALALLPVIDMEDIT